jgi:hypothetical protein
MLIFSNLQTGQRSGKNRQGSPRESKSETIANRWPMR